MPMTCFHIQYSAAISIFLIPTRKREGDAPPSLTQALKSSYKLLRTNICRLVLLVGLPANTVYWVFKALPLSQLPNKYNPGLWAGKKILPASKKAPTTYPGKTPQTTNCYRIMSPCYITILLHTASVQSLLPNALLPVFRWVVGLKHLSAPSIKAFWILGEGS